MLLPALHFATGYGLTGVKAISMLDISAESKVYLLSRRYESNIQSAWEKVVGVGAGEPNRNE